MSAVYSANALAETSSSLFPLCSILAVFDRCDMDKSGNIDVTELGTLNCNQHNPDSLVVAHCSTWFVPRKEMHAAAGMNPTEKEAPYAYHFAVSTFSKRSKRLS